MKIEYKFVDGTVTEIEVEESIGAFIADSRRKENNLARKERYHCYSLDAMPYGDKNKFMPHAEDSLDIFNEEDEADKHLYDTFGKLSKIQQRRMLMLAAGMSIREIAQKEGVHHSAVSETIEAARKKFKKFF